MTQSGGLGKVVQEAAIAAERQVGDRLLIGAGRGGDLVASWVGGASVVQAWQRVHVFMTEVTAAQCCGCRVPLTAMLT
jgi:hypothetical protein